ncbi:hypothetical protein RV14_GL002188 [Enterococcus ratti]|uniref:Uncharacterized protein n=1 Tax=Enterococcus ratti TaxID=150033 RepID=A0A1L8WNL2_9ENTE|nr:hypothetical protein RV14_GL002188 [Enterococcus ratti]
MLKIKKALTLVEGLKKRQLEKGAHRFKRWAGVKMKKC